MRPDELTTLMKPPKEMVEAILTLGEDASDAWHGGEDVSDGIADAYSTYEAWCKAEQDKRFGVLLEHMGFSELANDSSENALKWKRLAMTLAQMSALPGLRPPTPQFKKPPGRKNEDDRIFVAIKREHEKARRPISDAEAFRRAQGNDPWMKKQSLRRFEDAKARWKKRHPDQPT
jgi:hypothetical protein